MKLISSLALFILILPFTSAYIEITSQVNNEYNLGENIDFSVRIAPIITTDALIRLTLKCTNKEMTYYTAPINLEKDKETRIEAPPIKAISEGLCNIKANVESLEGEDLYGIKSNDFVITDKMDLSFIIDKTEALPGETIKIKGTANKEGNAVKERSIAIKIDDDKEQMELEGTEFSYSLRLSDNIKSGEHTITVEVNDAYGNFNEKSKKIYIEAIPKRLEFKLNKKEFKPKETLKLEASLLDQADEPIKKNIGIKLFKKKTLFEEEVMLFEQNIDTNNEFELAFNSDTPPNNYILKSTFNNLEKEEIIKILPHVEIEINLEGNNLIITNLGNVEYNNKTTIILEKEGKTYIINKKVRLKVGETKIIDLSRELPSGNYTINLPSKTEEKIIEKVVYTEDNRPLQKKVPAIFISAFIVIILAIICYLGRKRILRVIKKIRKN